MTDPSDPAREQSAAAAIPDRDRVGDYVRRAYSRCIPAFGRDGYGPSVQGPRLERRLQLLLNPHSGG